MEAKKHSSKKKWAEYLLEFFMLFFAVFLGFVAENYRQNQSDNDKKLHYIKSLVQSTK